LGLYMNVATQLSLHLNLLERTQRSGTMPLKLGGGRVTCPRILGPRRTGRF
jgi:hypothetical protein